MFHFLQTYSPDPVLISLGPLNIYWYGVMIVVGLLAAIFVIFRLADQYAVAKDRIIDLVFWLVLAGLAGARAYHVLLELSYYTSHPFEIFMFWHGGLAIHGGIFAGLLTLYFLIKKYRLDFWLIASLFAPALALAQAIGRFGNYFNQELFGAPTRLPWGIFIEPWRRPAEYAALPHFHPTFLYESIGNLLIFAILLGWHYYNIKNKRAPDSSFLLFYLALYSALRFFMEFIRLDETIVIAGLRLPQIVSLLIIIAAGLILYFRFISKKIVKNHS